MTTYSGMWKEYFAYLKVTLKAGAYNLQKQ